MGQDTIAFAPTQAERERRMKLAAAQMKALADEDDDEDDEDDEDEEDGQPPC